MPLKLLTLLTKMTMLIGMFTESDCKTGKMESQYFKMISNNPITLMLASTMSSLPDLVHKKMMEAPTSLR